MTNDGGPAVDTGREAVERLARRLSSIPLDMTVNEFDAAGATLRALLAERDAATAHAERLAGALKSLAGLAAVPWMDAAAQRLRIWTDARAALAPEPPQ